MADLNKVFLMGNLTRDPEVRYTSSGTAVTDIGVAINRVYSVEGEKHEDVTFVDVQIWGPQAESEFLRKGRPVIVETNPQPTHKQIRPSARISSEGCSASVRPNDNILLGYAKTNHSL